MTSRFRQEFKDLIETTHEINNETKATLRMLTQRKEKVQNKITKVLELSNSFRDLEQLEGLALKQVY